MPDPTTTESSAPPEVAPTSLTSTAVTTEKGVKGRKIQYNGPEDEVMAASLVWQKGKSQNIVEDEVADYLLTHPHFKEVK